ncbi:MAG: hypothetical protein AMXMBFR82_44670 [Candidatus Hydrogenedentota bacterium]
MRLRLCLSVLCAAWLLTVPRAMCCTIFMAESDGAVLAGNNEDYYLDAKPLMWVMPAKKEDHGRICFGFDEGMFSRFAQGGVNDAGLFFDAAVTPPGPEPSRNGKIKAPSNMGDRMLADCATVEEAIAWLERRHLTLLRGSHLLLADAGGDAAVVELVEGEMRVFRKDGSCLAATNFSLANPGAGNYPCLRYALVTEVLGGDEATTVDSFTKILQACAAPRTPIGDSGREGGTLYSNVYDLTNQVIHLYRKGGFDDPIRIDVRAYLERGVETYRLDEMDE